MPTRVEMIGTPHAAASNNRQRNMFGRTRTNKAIQLLIKHRPFFPVAHDLDMCVYQAPHRGPLILR